ncbi:hypothetical protein PG984_000137 [Apiospora sp. TS-2023a]
MAPKLSPEIWHLVFLQLSLEAAQIEREEVKAVNPADLRRARRQNLLFLDRRSRNPPARALLDLCLVSRGFAALAQPLLFRRYDSGFWRRLAKPAHLLFLGEAVLTNPGLGRHVREAHLDDDTQLHDTELPGDVVFDATRYAEWLWSRMASRLGFDGQVFPCPSTAYGGTVAFFSLLSVLFFPELEVLWVDMASPSRALGFLGRLGTLGVTRPLERLRDLTLQYTEDSLSFELSVYFPLLALAPNLTTLHLVRCELAWDPDPEAERNRGLKRAIPQGITTLEIRQSYFGDESAGLLLQHFRSLRRFVYYSRHRRDRDEVTFREFRRHLPPSRDTLEEIELHYWTTLLGGHEVCERVNQLRDEVPEFPALRVYNYWFPGGSSGTSEEGESLDPWGQLQLPPVLGDSYPGSSEEESEGEEEEDDENDENDENDDEDEESDDEPAGAAEVAPVSSRTRTRTTTGWNNRKAPAVKRPKKPTYFLDF